MLFSLGLLVSAADAHDFKAAEVVNKQLSLAKDKVAVAHPQHARKLDAECDSNLELFRGLLCPGGLGDIGDIFVNLFNANPPASPPGTSPPAAPPPPCTETTVLMWECLCANGFVGMEVTSSNNDIICDKCKSEFVADGGKESDCSSDDPCFAKDTLAISAEGHAIPMAMLKAGDVVMDGAGSTTRVIVNQHRAVSLKSSLLELEHANGKISLTGDHVLEVDGNFVPARLALPGSKLGASEVSRVTTASGEVVNPLTTSGKILTQDGVLATTYPEWVAEYMLSSYLVPLPLSLSNLISYLFPETTQAYYDALIEPLVTKAHPKHLKTALPAVLYPVAFLLGDVALSAGFAAFALASPVAALAGIATILAAAKARK